MLTISAVVQVDVVLLLGKDLSLGFCRFADISEEFHASILYEFSTIVKIGAYFQDNITKRRLITEIKRHGRPASEFLGRNNHNNYNSEC